MSRQVPSQFIHSTAFVHRRVVFLPSSSEIGPSGMDICPIRGCWLLNQPTPLSRRHISLIQSAKWRMGTNGRKEGEGFIGQSFFVPSIETSIFIRTFLCFYYKQQHFHLSPLKASQRSTHQTKAKRKEQQLRGHRRGRRGSKDNKIWIRDGASAPPA